MIFLKQEHVEVDPRISAKESYQDDLEFYQYMKRIKSGFLQQEENGISFLFFGPIQDKLIRYLITNMGFFRYESKKGESEFKAELYLYGSFKNVFYERYCEGKENELECVSCYSQDPVTFEVTQLFRFERLVFEEGSILEKTAPFHEALNRASLGEDKALIQQMFTFLFWQVQEDQKVRKSILEKEKPSDGQKLTLNF